MSESKVEIFVEGGLKSEYKKYWRGNCATCRNTFIINYKTIPSTKIESSYDMTGPYFYYKCPVCKNNTTICFKEHSDEIEVNTLTKIED